MVHFEKISVSPMRARFTFSMETPAQLKRFKNCPSPGVGMLVLVVTCNAYDACQPPMKLSHKSTKKREMFVSS